MLLADAAADEVEDQQVVDTVVDADAEADAAEAEESNDGGNVIEAIVVVADAAATIFDEEALRTQLSRLDTKVSSAEPTPTPVVHGDAALYSVAEVICLPMSTGSGDTDAAVPGNGLPARLVNAEELLVITCCCSCC